MAWVSSWLEGVWDGKKSKPLLPSFKALRTWRRCPWWDTLDERDPVELSIIARDIYVRKNPLQTSPALAQLVILETPVVELEEADELSETERGAGGFGSSGVQS